MAILPKMALRGVSSIPPFKLPPFPAQAPINMPIVTIPPKLPFKLEGFGTGQPAILDELSRRPIATTAFGPTPRLKGFGADQPDLLDRLRGKPFVSEPLEQEAKKFKSAREFVKAQNLQKSREEDVFTRPEFFDKGTSGISNAVEGFSKERPLLAQNITRKSIVFRDKDGNPQGVLSFDTKKDGTLDTEGNSEIFVNPKFRRQNIATKLRQKANQLGFDISKIKDRSFTEEGRKFEEQQLTDIFNKAQLKDKLSKRK